MTAMIFLPYSWGQGKGKETWCSITGANRYMRSGRVITRPISSPSWNMAVTTAHPITDPPMDIREHPHDLLEEPLLYNVNVDPGEKYNIARRTSGNHSRTSGRSWRSTWLTLEEVENQLEKR
jgi:hypothetical protein